jgi:hypothetical protein
MPVGGFQLLEMFFLSSNINSARLRKVEPPQQVKASKEDDDIWDATYVGWQDSDDQKDDKKDDQDQSTDFEVLCDPKHLQNM